MGQQPAQLATSLNNEVAARNSAVVKVTYYGRTPSHMGRGPNSETYIQAQWDWLPTVNHTYTESDSPRLIKPPLNPPPQAWGGSGHDMK